MSGRWVLLEREAAGPGDYHKSGVMAGLGEEMDELLAVFRDLASVGVDILTVGQYLRPSKDHLAMARYYTPDEFAEMKTAAMEMGFRHVEVGPLVRRAITRMSRPVDRVAGPSVDRRPSCQVSPFAFQQATI